MNTLFKSYSSLQQLSWNTISLINMGRANFATKMQASSTQKTKDSAGKRLGIKRFGGEEVFPGDIIARQRGFKWHPGKNTYFGKDHTIHSKIEGKVSFEKDPWRRKKKLYINIVPQENPNRKVRPPPPYCYHPELFPDRAANNPQPTNIPMPKKIPKKPRRTDIFGVKTQDLKYQQKIFLPSEYLTREKQELQSFTEKSIERIKFLESKYLSDQLKLESTPNANQIAGKQIN